jgi:hypothetical protein
MAVPQRLESGKRLADDDTLNGILATPQWQTNVGIAAVVGGTVSTSTQLTLGSNVVATSTGAGTDGVVLPNGTAGAIVYMFNNSGNTITVFAPQSGTINGTAGAIGVTYATAKRVLFIAVDNNVWIANVMSAT